MTDADQHSRDLLLERQRVDRVNRAASELLAASGELGWGSGVLLPDAMRWLIEAARLEGHDTSTVIDPLADLLRASRGWPSTAHLRLHWLAGRDGGWNCQGCGIGLVDVCSDEHVVPAADGGRTLRPGCDRRLPTIDHVVPRDLGGSDEPENLRLVCQPCNSRKGAA